MTKREREYCNRKKQIKEYRQYQECVSQEPEMIECPGCYGTGSWEVECCNGAGGCSCRGGLVDMGQCRICHGSGQVVKDNYDPRANSNFIMSAGACFAGSGPSSGYWAGKPALNRPSVNW